MDYEALLNLVRTHYDRKKFLAGLGVVAGLYVLIFTGLLLNKNAILEAQEDQLASETVIIPWKSIKLSTEMQASMMKTPEAQDIPSLSDEEEALVPAPLEGLYETTPLGRLPVVNKAQNMTAFSAYKRSFPFYKTDKPLIMLGIIDLGLSAVATESAIRTMPSDVSFIFSPYAADMELWVREARSRGHEVWLSFPAEPKNYPLIDPGPHTLLKGVPERENLKKFRWLLGRADGYIGFVGGRDTHLSGSITDYKPILQKMFERGLGFVDTSQDPSPIPQSMALSMKTGYGRADVIIDRVPTEDGINSALTELERTAEQKGYAVGIFHPVPLSYQKVLLWAKTLNKRGFVLAPLSASTAFAENPSDNNIR